MDALKCPKCKSENTYQVQDWLGEELRECEDCGCEYTVTYKLKISKIKIN